MAPGTSRCLGSHLLSTPRQDLLTKDNEQHQQTLLRRPTNQQRDVEMEGQERKLKEPSETIMKSADNKTPGTNQKSS